jgi:hypothetical protein
MTDDPAFKVLMANAHALERGAIAMWTVYEKPLDHPDGFIARRFEIARGSSAPTEDTLTGELEEIRLTLERAGMIKFDRNPADEPQIVETWI